MNASSHRDGLLMETALPAKAVLPSKKKKGKRLTTNQFSRKFLEDQGYEVGLVERFNWITKRRNDLFGCIDMIAIRSGFSVLGIQNCAFARLQDHVRKCTVEPRIKTWILTGSRFLILAWDKRKLVRGGKALKWHCTEKEITLSDLN